MTDAAFGMHGSQAGSPEQVFGFPADRLLEAAETVQGMGPISQRIAQDGRILGGLVGLFPLLEKLRGQEDISRGDIHAHRTDIEDVVHPLVDEFMPSSILLRPFGAVGKVTLDLIVEREFPRVVPFAMQKAKDYIPRAEPYIAVMSGFENPRQQFTDEVNALNSMVIEDIKSRSVGEPTPFTASRSLRGVLLSDLLRDPDAAASDLPILSRLIVIRNSRADVGKEVELSELAALAPGVMMMLGSLAPQDGRRPDIIKALKENPLPEDAHSIDREDLDRFERSAPMILPITRALIPQTGAEIQEKFEQVKAFLA